MTGGEAYPQWRDDAEARRRWLAGVDDAELANLKALALGEAPGDFVGQIWARADPRTFAPLIVAMRLIAERTPPRVREMKLPFKE
jgi:hypothetical protein